jgi:Tfp pilus assembly PilM family ATPase
MSDLLSLEWEHDEIRGVLAQVSSGHVRIVRSIALPRPQGSGSSSGPLNVDWLKSELARNAITVRDVVICLPRDEAVVKRLELPEVPDDELPALVRFQAGAKSATPIDELALDFIPLPKRSELPGREVTMAAVLKQTIDEVRMQCERAGLNLLAMGLAPAAVAQLAAHARPKNKPAPTGESLLVGRHGSRLEISVLRNGHLLFSHSTRLSDESALSADAQPIVSEVSRALVSLRGAVADVRIEEVWTLVAEREHEPLAAALTKRLSCEVYRLDPLAHVECAQGAFSDDTDRSHWACPVGMLVEQAKPLVPRIDFLAPRKPPVKRDTRKARLKMAGIAAGAVSAVFLAIFFWRVHSLSAQIAQLEQQEKTLSTALEKGSPDLTAAKQLDEWRKMGDVWIDQLKDVTERMPATDRIYLGSLEFMPRTANSPATIKMQGLSREPADVEKLIERFHTNDDRFRVLPHLIEPSTDNPFYPWKFTQILQILDVSKKAGSSKQAPSPEKKQTDKNEANAEAEKSARPAPAADSPKPEAAKPDSPKPESLRETPPGSSQPLPEQPKLNPAGSAVPAAGPADAAAPSAAPKTPAAIQEKP